MSNGTPKAEELTSDKVPDISELTSAPQSDEPGAIRSFAGGVAQGALFDPIEGIGQLIEHATGHNIPIPQGVRDWFDDYKEKYTQEGAGQYGRIAGTVGSIAVPMFGAAKAAGWLGRATAAQVGTRAVERALASPKTVALEKVAERVGKGKTTMGKPTASAKAAQAKLAEPPPASVSQFTGALPNAARGAAIGVGAGAAQPVEEGQDYWKTKSEQMAGGGLGGGLGELAAKTLTAPAVVGGMGFVAKQVYDNYGIPGVLAMGTSLGALAHHFHMFGHHGVPFGIADKIFDIGGKARKFSSKVAKHSAGQYATGRAGAAYGPDAVDDDR